LLGGLVRKRARRVVPHIAHRERKRASALGKRKQKATK
jgi:hypothetical protein